MYYFLLVHNCIVLQYADIEAVNLAESASTMQPYYRAEWSVTVLKLKGSNGFMIGLTCGRFWHVSGFVLAEQIQNHNR